MSEWPTVRFEELAAAEKSAFSKPYGSAITKEDYIPQGIPVVRGVNLSKGVFLDDEFVFISGEKADQIPGANLAPGDLVFTHRGTVGQISMIPRTPRYHRYVLSTSQVKARLDPKRSLPEFYYYWFSSPDGQHELLQNVSTVGVPGLGQPVATIKSLRVPSPPLTIQKSIAAALGALDDKIAVNERITLTALELSRSIYRNFSADASTSSELGNFVSLKYGKALREAERREGATPVYGCTGQVGWHDTPLTSGPTPVVGRKGANAGWVSWSPKPCWVIDTAFFVDINAKFISPEVAFLILETANLPALVGDSAVPGLNRDAAHKQLIKVLEPAAAAEVSERVRPLMTQATRVEQESRTLAALRDTLLPQLMSGKLRVRDAERIVEDAL
ncbi:type I restriction enzyme S subunit [Streptosporangium becharense]|uniref:Type I restriction enzyme S subunit n=1 Tax=Streptosporangium becharense TaxID=1816182 RepID=A0A7W9IJ37_9ACTN|nr:restriction endonuclease subunit S [Streptosporangium becharense]MBB2911254.1 type I restriction enzyme S subunit [Streptosporangium becharense]MBB5821688.1 type I restriction enzyme S subunit [Streptosporangium becharense]